MASEVQRGLGAGGEPLGVLGAHHGGIIPFLRGDELAERVGAHLLLLGSKAAHALGRDAVEHIRRQGFKAVHRGGENARLGGLDHAVVRPGVELAALRHERIQIGLRNIRAGAQKQRRERDAGIVQRGGAVSVHGGGGLIDRVFHGGIMLHGADGLIRRGQERA